MTWPGVELNQPYPSDGRRVVDCSHGWLWRTGSAADGG